MIWNFLIPHVRYWISQGNEVELACSRTGFYFDELRDVLKVKMYEIPFERFPFKKKNITSYRILNRLVRKKRYDIVISQEPVGGVIGRMVGARNHCKNVYTAHGFHFFKGASLVRWLLYFPVEKFMSRYTDVLVTINDEDFERSKKFHVKKIKKIDGIGVDLNKYHYDPSERSDVRKQLGIKDDDFIILTVAEMIERTNYETSLKALADLPFNFKYLICGDGEIAEKLKKMAKELKLEDKVSFMGFRKDVNKIYQVADVFLFPSFQEGLSIALIEAMASGLPIVCSRIRGNVDLIQDGKGGLLYEPTDHKGFNEGIKKIYRDRGSYGEFNRSFVKRFSVENSVKSFYEAINM